MFDEYFLTLRPVAWCFDKLSAMEESIAVTSAILAYPVLDSSRPPEIVFKKHGSSFVIPFVHTQIPRTCYIGVM